MGNRTVLCFQMWVFSDVSMFATLPTCVVTALHQQNLPSCTIYINLDLPSLLQTTSAAFLEYLGEWSKNTLSPESEGFGFCLFFFKQNIKSRKNGNILREKRLCRILHYGNSSGIVVSIFYFIWDSCWGQTVRAKVKAVEGSLLVHLCSQGGRLSGATPSPGERFVRLLSLRIEFIGL